MNTALLNGGNMRFLILWAGGLGGYFGGMLQHGGADVTFLVRPGRAAQLAARGLVIRTAAGTIEQSVKTVLAGEVDDHYDCVFLACKAYDLDSAIEAITPAIGPDTAILPVLNGINHIAVLGERLGADHVLGGMTIVSGALTPEGDVVRNPGTPDNTAFGELNGVPSARCQAIHDAFMAGGVPTRISDQIVAEMWSKFAGFASNALIASLTRGRTGEIAATSDGATFVSSAFDECAKVTTAEGYPPASAIRNLILEIHTRIGSALAPSILADLEGGRRTEGDHVLGDLLRRAERHGLDVPLIRAAVCSLQVHEARVAARIESR
jgi:2-dehydropantoate 2-reductase